jgi:hypothetical protein
MIAEVRLFELLKAKIGIQEAEAFIEIMDTRIEKKFEEKKEVLATKVDIVRLEGLIETKIANCKADLIKWMVANTIAIITIMAVLFSLK